jgi:CCR4-NOT transcription complex subunit 11
MEIYDKPAKREKEVVVEDTTGQEDEDPESLKDRWISLIIASPNEHMPAESVDFIMNRLQGALSRVTPQLVTFTARHLPATVEINFQWTVKLLELILGHRQLRADPKLSEPRQELMTAITRLPSTIMPMDLITTLLIKGCVEDVPWMVHGFLANALRTIEHMGSRAPTSAHTQHLEQYYDESSSSPVTPPEASGLPTPIIERGRAAQAQAIRLLAVFINSLVTKRLMTVQDLYFEIEEIGVRYIWIPEARGFLGEMRRLSESWV